MFAHHLLVTFMQINLATHCVVKGNVSKINKVTISVQNKMAALRSKLKWVIFYVLVVVSQPARKIAKFLSLNGILSKEN